MLAGIVVTFAINAVKTIPVDPWLILPLIAAFFSSACSIRRCPCWRCWSAAASSPCSTGRVGGLPAPELSTLTLIAPHFTPPAVIGLALPLYLVTMASQNLSGLAVLRAAGYRPRSPGRSSPSPVCSLLSAPFGALTTNLAAISAAICTGPDVHPDPAERWKTGPFYALAYLVFAVFGASLVAIFAVLPQSLIVLVAGLALMAALANALAIALRTKTSAWRRRSTFAVTASGLTLFGIGSAFWGLVGRAGRARPRLPQKTIIYFNRFSGFAADDLESPCFVSHFDLQQSS